MTVGDVEVDAVHRANRFRYTGLDVTSHQLVGHYDLDGTPFSEKVDFSVDGDVRDPAPRALAELWYLIAGLSYYKAGAARTIDLHETPVGPAGLALLRAAVLDGLGEFAYRNDLWLDDVAIVGGRSVERVSYVATPDSVVIPFGGGIDSVVTVRNLRDTLVKKLFVMSPASGRFAPLEETAAHTGLSVARATRTLDPAITSGNPALFNGHVPVTAMVTLLACVAATAEGRSGVVMSNEHSASEPNLLRDGVDVNHQWSKSWLAELLIADAVAERVGDGLTVASFLRDRSELWVAQQMAGYDDVLHAFRSCNRAFRQDAAQRALRWCGECDKCLFIALVMAPFMPRRDLDAIFDGTSPLARPDLLAQLTVLVGLGKDRKPFECVGDPVECAVALRAVAASREWSDCPWLATLAQQTSVDASMDELLLPMGKNRVPAEWLS